MHLIEYNAKTKNQPNLKPANKCFLLFIKQQQHINKLRTVNILYSQNKNNQYKDNY